MKRANYIQVCRYSLIVLWIYSAGSKLWGYSIFLTQLTRQPLPYWSIPILGWLFPIIEIIAVTLLSFQRTMYKGFLLSFLLMLAFTVYVGLGLAHVYATIPCSCGGILGKMGWVNHFIFNVFFTIVAFVGWCLSKDRTKSFAGYRPLKA